MLAVRAALILLAALAMLAARPPASAQTPGADATLSGLTLSEGRLSPAFASGTTAYTASVGYTVTRIAVVPGTTDANATVAYLDSSDMPLTDANTVTQEQDVDLAVGETVVKVKITAEDTSTVQPYTVTITRTAEDTSLSPPPGDPVAANPSTAVYSVTFQGAWTSSVTPDGVPGGAHFSRLIGGVHSAAVTFLEGGQTASAGVESMAEVGGVSDLKSEVQTAIDASPQTALSVLEGDTDSIGPLVSKTFEDVELTTEYPRVTLTTMVARSPDWFVGVSGLPLLGDQGHWLRSHEVHLYPWDAGTEDGSEFSLNNLATSPQGVITSIRGTGKFSTEPIATLAFALQSVRTILNVAENTAAGTDIGAPLTLPGTGTVTYTLGGTDAASFDIVASSGQVQTKGALDYETKSSYEVTVTATDTDGSVTTTVAIEVTNVIELTAITGPATASFAENGGGRVATYTASSEEDGGGITWSLSGTDASDFSVDAPGGALRFHIDAVAPNLYPLPPDFEAPSSADMDNEYTLTVTASDGTNSLTSNVTVTVTNEDEMGTLTLSSSRPRLGTALTATLSDPDTVTGTAAWTWERSAGRSAWTVIDGATAAGYTPVAADTGHFLRVKASYAGQTVSAVPPEVVAGALLSHLAVTTNDSAGGAAWRQIKPAFDGGTLHYAVGCGNTDTMVLTLSAALSGTRVAVNGIQTTSQNASVEVAVTGTSVVPITLTDSEGGSTTYAVHCIPSDFEEVTTIKRVATGVMEDLIIFGRHYDTDSYTQESYLTIIDNNGVPRYLRKLDHKVPLFIRYHKTPDGEWKYSYGKGNNDNGEIVLLDQSLEEVARVTTVAPLIRTNYHDHHILDDGNYLLMAYELTARDLSHLQGFIDENGDPVTYGTAVDVRDSAIQIRTPAGVAVFTWNSWDAIPLEDCAAHRFPPASGDYAHVNGLQLYDGDIIATFRGCSAVLRIDPDGDTTHNVVWRLGRTNLSDEEWLAAGKGPPPMTFVGDPEGEFCGMHAGQLLPNGSLLIFDNGTDCLIDPRTRESKRESLQFSRAVEYAIDEANGEVVFQRAHSLHGTETFLTWSSGHVEDLANGDWLISWGTSPTLEQVSEGAGERPDEAATQVDPDTGVEKFSLKLLDSVETRGQQNIRAVPLSPVALATEPTPLQATLPPGGRTSVFHSGTADSPQVVVAFSRPVVDFDNTSLSLSVAGATVASVSAHVVAGSPANAYLVTLTPDGAGAITFRLVTGQTCASGGICTADGTMLSEAPAALVIGPPVTVSFEQATYSVTEGASRSVAVRLSSAHQGVRGITIPVVLATTGNASADDLTVDESVTFEAGETRKLLAVNARGDDLVEGAETATLGFGTLPHGVTAGSTSTATMTLTDADQAQIAFTTGATQVSEGGQTQLRFAITNGVTFELDQAINLTLSGTATAGDDFTLADAGNQLLSAPYAITFPAGASSVEATIRAVDDADIEPVAETIAVSAQLGLTGASLGTRTIAIPASDVPDTPVVDIAPGSTVVEGTDATFTLWRTASSSLPLSDPLTVSVEVTATGSTLGGAAPTTVRFEGGDATADLAVPTLDDSVVEPPGSVTALVRGSTSNPPLYLTRAANSATVNVNDNDVAAFTLSADAADVVEGGTVRLTVTADGVTFAEPQTITLTPGGTATPVDDFTLSAGGGELTDPHAVTLPAHASSVAVTVTALRDGEADAAETIEVSASHDGSSIGRVTITITEPPPPPVVVPVTIVGGGGGGGGGGGFGGGPPPGPEPSDEDFHWTVDRDIEELDSGNDRATGVWSDGTTLWVADNADGAGDAVYAYDREGGERVEEREFALHETNRAPRGFWSDGETVWVSDSGRERLFAYRLADGERLEEREFGLPRENRDARGIWSDEETMWVLDGRADALFAYDFETGELLAEYELADANGDPRGIWSDGTTVWVSDHGAKRLFAYRLPAPEGPAAEDADDDRELDRVRDEEFSKLSRASNNSPRGLWSDGDVMYVADESDDKVYSYNMPDAIDARLASLTLSGVDIGEFDPGRTDYEAVVADGVTETTVEAEAMQRRTDVAIDPPDADVEADGHQVALDGRQRDHRHGDLRRRQPETKTYRVELAEAGPSASCLRGAVSVGFSLVVSEGGSLDDLVACAGSRHVTALYVLDGGEYVSYIVGAPELVNTRFVELFPDGVPALTPLIARSDGPATDAPAASAVTEPWAACLQGEIVEGFNLVLYEGGSIDDLDACAEGVGLAALYALSDGVWVSYILGAPEFVNRSFRELFTDGLPVATPLVGKSN